MYLGFSSLAINASGFWCHWNLGSLEGQKLRKGRYTYWNIPITPSHAEHLTITKNVFLGVIITLFFYYHSYGWLIFLKHWLCSWQCVMYNCHIYTWTGITWPAQSYTANDWWSHNSVSALFKAPALKCSARLVSSFGQ